MIFASSNRKHLLAERVRNRPIRLAGVGSVGQALAVADYGWDGLFLSGLAHTYESLGLSDEGFLSFDMQLGLVARIRQRLPGIHIVVDIDTGLAGPVSSVCEIARRLEAAGASAVVLEDQDLTKKRCGHLAGKALMPIHDYAEKLDAVVGAVDTLAVVARTDASTNEDATERMRAYASVGPDYLLIDGVTDLSVIAAAHAECALPFAFNQMHKGKSPRANANALHDLGVKLIIYSAPCTFASIRAVHEELASIDRCRGALPEKPGFGLADLNALILGTNDGVSKAIVHAHPHASQLRDRALAEPA